MCRKFAIKGFKANLFGEKQKVSLYIILYFFFFTHLSCFQGILWITEQRVRYSYSIRYMRYRVKMQKAI